jgi:hypothetical protein
MYTLKFRTSSGECKPYVCVKYAYVSACMHACMHRPIMLSPGTLGMYVCVCVCIYIWIHMCASSRSRRYVCMYVFMYVCGYMYASPQSRGYGAHNVIPRILQECMYVYVYVYACMCMDTHICITLVSGVWSP